MKLFVFVLVAAALVAITLANEVAVQVNHKWYSEHWVYVLSAHPTAAPH